MASVSKISTAMIEGKIVVAASVSSSNLVTLTFSDGTTTSFTVGGSGGATPIRLRLSETDVANGGGNNGGNNGSTTYTPSVTLGSSSINTSGSLVVNVTGAPPSSSVSVSVKDSAGSVKATSTFTTAADGTGTGTSSPGLAAGTYNVEVAFDSSKTYSTGNTVTKDLTVQAASSTSYLPSLMIANGDIAATTAKVTILTGPPGSTVNVHVAKDTPSGNVTFLDTTVTLNSIGTGVLNVTGLTSKASYLIDFNFDTAYTYNPAYAKYLSTYITTL